MTDAQKQFAQIECAKLDGWTLAEDFFKTGSYYCGFAWRERCGEGNPIWCAIDLGIYFQYSGIIPLIQKRLGKNAKKCALFCHHTGITKSRVASVAVHQLLFLTHEQLVIALLKTEGAWKD